MAYSGPLRYSVLALRHSMLALTLITVVGCSNTVRFNWPIERLVENSRDKVTVNFPP
ncbi:hypothetical protein [Moritella viscosa]|uniref:Uncharacterized protein n=1 Tax=Moritella viscosa TaxID=80854 RepID=A0A1K9Z8N3_9GAMM|nr:hypothetical protein [Moritella viscosa]SGY86680.1 Putative uncharacterized protein [Moritella viscosa]SGY88061.1 Putative uncharacterized protein [Moritella viscosa]SGY90024.1 Putative uncharacterized protein [Moritella viscosa]SGY90570.1 Putative uncharacterized protein [Moritella viscosa]SHO00962.1 Putative uncharacterized protein [Moritella viscosa]